MACAGCWPVCSGRQPRSLRQRAPCRNVRVRAAGNVPVGRHLLGRGRAGGQRRLHLDASDTARARDPAAAHRAGPAAHPGSRHHAAAAAAHQSRRGLCGRLLHLRRRSQRQQRGRVERHRVAGPRQRHQRPDPGPPPQRRQPLCRRRVRPGRRPRRQQHCPLGRRRLVAARCRRGRHGPSPHRVSRPARGRRQLWLGVRRAGPVRRAVGRRALDRLGRRDRRTADAVCRPQRHAVRLLPRLRRRLPGVVERLGLDVARLWRGRLCICARRPRRRPVCRRVVCVCGQRGGVQHCALGRRGVVGPGQQQRRRRQWRGQRPAVGGHGPVRGRRLLGGGPGQRRGHQQRRRLGRRALARPRRRRGHRRDQPGHRWRDPPGVVAVLVGRRPGRPVGRHRLVQSVGRARPQRLRLRCGRPRRQQHRSRGAGRPRHPSPRRDGRAAADRPRRSLCGRLLHPRRRSQRQQRRRVERHGVAGARQRYGRPRKRFARERRRPLRRWVLCRRGRPPRQQRGALGRRRLVAARCWRERRRPSHRRVPGLCRGRRLVHPGHGRCRPVRGPVERRHLVRRRRRDRRGPVHVCRRQRHAVLGHVGLLWRLPGVVGRRQQHVVIRWLWRRRRPGRARQSPWPPLRRRLPVAGRRGHGRQPCPVGRRGVVGGRQRRRQRRGERLFERRALPLCWRRVLGLRPVWRRRGRQQRRRVGRYAVVRPGCRRGLVRQQPRRLWQCHPRVQLVLVRRPARAVGRVRLDRVRPRPERLRLRAGHGGRELGPAAAAAGADGRGDPRPRRDHCATRRERDQPLRRRLARCRRQRGRMERDGVGRARRWDQRRRRRADADAARRLALRWRQL